MNGITTSSRCRPLSSNGHPHFSTFDRKITALAIFHFVIVHAVGSPTSPCGDWNIPGKDGYYLIDEIKDRHPGSLIITAFGSEEYERGKAVSKGAAALMELNC